VWLSWLVLRRVPPVKPAVQRPDGRPEQAEGEDVSAGAAG